MDKLEKWNEAVEAYARFQHILNELIDMYDYDEEYIYGIILDASEDFRSTMDELDSQLSRIHDWD